MREPVRRIWRDRNGPARMEDDAQTLEAGMRGEVVEISGVKLILRAVEAENQK